MSHTTIVVNHSHLTISEKILLPLATVMFVITCYFIPPKEFRLILRS